jgi:hypothetical protein
MLTLTCLRCSTTSSARYHASSLLCRRLMTRWSSMASSPALFLTLSLPPRWSTIGMHHPRNRKGSRGKHPSRPRQGLPLLLPRARVQRLVAGAKAPLEYECYYVLRTPALSSRSHKFNRMSLSLYKLTSMWEIAFPWEA